MNEDMLKSTVLNRIRNENEFMLLSLPDHLLELRHQCLDKDSNPEDILNLIKQDPGFVAELLKIVNASYYGVSGKTITSIEQAVFRMGLDQVANYAVFYATKILSHVEDGPEDILVLMRDNWKRSNLLASESTTLADALKKSGEIKRLDPSKVLTSGVLYYASYLAVYGVAMELIENGKEISKESIQSVGDALHYQLLESILRYLNVPEAEISTIIHGAPMDASLYYVDLIHHKLNSLDEDKISEAIKARLDSLNINDLITMKSPIS